MVAFGLGLRFSSRSEVCFLAFARFPSLQSDFFSQVKLRKQRPEHPGVSTFLSSV